MSETFWGRRREITRLEQELGRIAETGRGRMVAVRGRRQAGKSRLLTHLVESSGLPYLYITAVKNAPPSTQLHHAATALTASRSPLPHLDTAFAVPPASWPDFFARLPLALGDSPAILVLDEFPWATETDPILEGLLQNAWDHSLERRPILFVLVGSDMAMMERLTEHDRPLFGRASEMVVSPLNPSECAEALGRDRPALDLLDAFLVTGGYPRLVLEARGYRTAQAFVNEQLRDENSDLAVVAQRVLDAEFRTDLQARSVLEAIGATEVGHANFTSTVALLGGDGAAQTAVTRALEPLERVKRVIAIDQPVGSRPNTRLRRYRVADPYLRFWFRFVGAHLDDIARGRSDLAVRRYERGWSSWRGKAIEPVVHEAVSRLARTEPEFAGVSRVGGWWERTGKHEVDVVGADERRAVRLIGAVKWRPRKAVTRAELDALAQARAMIPRAAAARLLVVSPAGGRSDASPDILLKAEDILAAFVE
jgi:AAA+ ATPase superfamily predicted ATPase